MRQQSHGFPVNGLNERIIFRESECGQRAGIWAMMCPALEAFCLMKVVCCRVVWQKEDSPVVS
jgi:hypothetical protein